MECIINKHLCKDKFKRTPYSYYFEDLMHNTLLGKPNYSVGLINGVLDQAVGLKKETIKTDNNIYELDQAKIAPDNLENFSKIRNTNIINTCDEIHEIFNNCCRILGPDFFKEKILSQNSGNISSGSNQTNNNGAKFETPKKRRSKKELVTEKQFKCNVPGCFKQYASRAALFLHVKRLHAPAPQSNFDKEINNDLIQVLEKSKVKLSNPNQKLRWGVDLDKVIKERFSNLKKEAESQARGDRSTYCDTVNNTLARRSTVKLNSSTKNLEIFSNSSQSNTNIRENNDDLFSLCSRNSNMFEGMSLHSFLDVCKPSSLESPERFWNTESKLFRKKVKCDNLSDDGNYDHKSLESRDQTLKSKNSLERFIFMSRSSNSNFKL